MNKNTAIIVIIILLVLAGLGWYFWANQTETYTPSSPTATTTVSETGGTPAATTTTTSSDTTTYADDEQVPPAATAAQNDLAAKLKISAQSIVIAKIENKTWNNGCLGLPKAGEFCTEALVPGYRIELKAQGTTYAYRANKAGTVVRAETQ